MKITCIADLHGFYPELPGGDLLIVAGDLTSLHTEAEHFEFNEWLENQEYKKIILVAGNHDTWIEKNECAGFADYDGQKVEYLCDSGTEFEGLKIWGSPYTASFKGIHSKCMAFTIHIGCDTDYWLDEHWQQIPEDIDILITHGPPFGILDETLRGECVGSKSLLIKSLEVAPRLHAYGHIHEQGGKQFIMKRPGYGDENNTIYINASIMNEKYQPVNIPITIEI